MRSELTLLMAAGALAWGCDASGPCPEKVAPASIEVDPARVEQVLSFEQSCRAGDERACDELLHQTIGKSAFGVELAELACDAGSAVACYHHAGNVASRSYLDPTRADCGITPARVREGFAEAYPSYDKACREGHIDACAEKGQAVILGAGAARDPRLGLQLLEAACAGHRDRPPPKVFSSGFGCFWLAEAYWDGIGRPPKRAYARRLLHESCRRDELGCDELTLSSKLGLDPWIVRWVALGVLGVSNALAAMLLVSRRMQAALGSKRRPARLLVTVVSAVFALLVGAELWFYHWGSSTQSPLWALAGLPAVVLPVSLWWRGR